MEEVPVVVRFKDSTKVVNLPKKISYVNFCFTIMKLFEAFFSSSELKIRFRILNSKLSLSSLSSSFSLLPQTIQNDLTPKTDNPNKKTKEQESEKDDSKKQLLSLLQNHTELFPTFFHHKFDYSLSSIANRQQDSSLDPEYQSDFQSQSMETFGEINADLDLEYVLSSSFQDPNVLLLLLITFQGQASESEQTIQSLIRNITMDDTKVQQPLPPEEEYIEDNFPNSERRRRIKGEDFRGETFNPEKALLEQVSLLQQVFSSLGLTDSLSRRQPSSSSISSHSSPSSLSSSSSPSKSSPHLSFSSSSSGSLFSSDDELQTFVRINTCLKQILSLSEIRERFSPPVISSIHQIGSQIDNLLQSYSSFISENYNNIQSSPPSSLTTPLLQLRDTNSRLSQLRQHLESLSSSSVSPSTSYRSLQPTTKKSSSNNVLSSIHYYCSHCSKEIKGVRYHCAACLDYDLCSQCEEKNSQRQTPSHSELSINDESLGDQIHPITHIFYRIDSNPTHGPLRGRIKSRYSPYSSSTSPQKKSPMSRVLKGMNLSSHSSLAEKIEEYTNQRLRNILSGSPPQTLLNSILSRSADSSPQNISPSSSPSSSSSLILYSPPSLWPQKSKIDVVKPQKYQTIRNDPQYSNVNESPDQCRLLWSLPPNNRSPTSCTCSCHSNHLLQCDCCTSSNSTIFSNPYHVDIPFYSPQPIPPSEQPYPSASHNSNHQNLCPEEISEHMTLM